MIDCIKPANATKNTDSIFHETVQAPNLCPVLKEIRLAGVIISSDGTDLTFKTTAGTTITTINLTTGNMTLGGTQKRVICTKVVGA